MGNSLSFMGRKSVHSLPAAADYGELRSPQGARTSGNAPLVSAWTVALASHRAVVVVNHPHRLLGKALMSHYFLEAVPALAGVGVIVVDDGRGCSVRHGCFDISWRLCVDWLDVPVCDTQRCSSADLGHKAYTLALRFDSTHIAACVHCSMQLAFSAPVGASNGHLESRSVVHAHSTFSTGH